MGTQPAERGENEGEAAGPTAARPAVSRECQAAACAQAPAGPRPRQGRHALTRAPAVALPGLRYSGHGQFGSTRADASAEPVLTCTRGARVGLPGHWHCHSTGLPPPPASTAALWGPDLGGGRRWEALPAAELPLLLTCLAPTGLASAAGATQDRFYVPEPPGHVEETRVSGGGRELPEHVHVCLGQGVPPDIATRAEVLVQGLHPGRLVTNAQDGPVGRSWKDRGTRHESGPGGLGPSADTRRASPGMEPQKQNHGCRGWGGALESAKWGSELRGWDGWGTGLRGWLEVTGGLRVTTRCALHRTATVNVT